MTRDEKVTEAQRLRAEGLKIREIAARMGVSRSTAGAYLADPDFAKHKARRMRYGGLCVDCGAATDGSRGPGKASKRCLRCEQRRNEERNARIVEAWERGETGKQIAKREGMTETAVHAWIDSQRQRHGAPIALHRRRDRELWPLIERRVNEGATYPEIAAECGTTRENISWMVRNMRRAGYDIPLHPGRRLAA